MSKSLGFSLLLIFLILITWAATATKYWVHWLTVTIMFLGLMLADTLFMQEGAFVFDPFMKVSKM